MSANLTSEMGVIDRIVILINECKKMKIQVKSPDINVSFEDFRPINKSTISYGMNAIKNVGSKALETIINDRKENGQFESIFDLCSRIDQQKVNKRVLESLVMSGTLDSLEGNRAQKFSAVDEAIKYGQLMQTRKDKNQVDMFSSLTDQENFNKGTIINRYTGLGRKRGIRKRERNIRVLCFRPPPSSTFRRFRRIHIFFIR